MPTLATTVNGLKLPNPFVIGSGPPGTNANVIGKAFDEGWGAVICKTVSLDAEKVVNVYPRYARLRAADPDVLWVAYAHDGLDGYAYVFPKVHHVNTGVGCLLSHFDEAVDARPYELQKRLVVQAESLQAYYFGWR